MSASIWFRQRVCAAACFMLVCSAVMFPGIAFTQAATGASSSFHQTLGADGPAQSNGATWQGLGPESIVSSGSQSQSYSGMASAIAVNQSDPSNIYVGTAGGGVWKTTDSGKNWSPIFDFEPSISVGAMTISPDGGTLYVGTGDEFVGAVPQETRYSGGPGTGLYKTSDGGKSWTQLGVAVFAAATVTSILLFPGDPSRILVSTGAGGIYLSEDGGLTWKMTCNIGEDHLASLPSDTLDVFASGLGSFLKSTDGGQTWQRLSDNTTGPTYITVSPSMPGSLYIAYSAGSDDPVSILRYDLSSGREYTLGEPPSAGDGSGVCGGQCNYDLVLAVDPTNSSVMYFGAQDLYASFDGGATWKDVGGYRAGPSNIHPDQHAIAFVPGSSDTVIVGNDGGVWESADGGADWIDLNTGLGTALLTSIALSSSGVILGGTQDNGCIEYSGSTSWKAVGNDSSSPIEDCVWTGIESSNPSVMYNEYGTFAFTFLKSTDAGETWSRSDSGLNLTAPAPFWAPVVAQDPLSPGTLYLGSDKIYKTTDFGETWTAVSGPVEARQVTAIAVAPSNDGVVYAGDDQGGIQVTTDGGASWKYVYYLQQLLTNPVTSIAVDPGNPLVAYASYVTGMIIKTTDGGETWTHVPVTGLSSTCAACMGIEVLKAGPGILYAGTDAGVYYSSDGGARWTRLGSGLPNAVVTDIVVTPSTVYAATYGRGVWEVSTAAASPSLATVIPTGGFGFLLSPIASVVAGGALVAAMLAVDILTWGRGSRWRWLLRAKWFLPLIAFVPAAIGYFSTVLPSPTQYASGSFSLLIVLFNQMVSFAGNYWYGWIPILVFAGASPSFGRRRVRKVIAMWVIALVIGFLCFAGVSALYNSASAGGNTLASYGIQFFLDIVFSAMIATLTVPLLLVQALSGASYIGIVIPVLALVLSFIISRLLARSAFSDRLRGGRTFSERTPIVHAQGSKVLVTTARAEIPAGHKKCRFCGNSLPSDSLYCDQCGNSVA